jgi:hypothetical protein
VRLYLANVYRRLCAKQEVKKKNRYIILGARVRNLALSVR